MHLGCGLWEVVALGDATGADRVQHPHTLIGGVKCLRLAIDWLEWHADGTLSDEGRGLLDKALPLDSYGDISVGYASGYWSYRVYHRPSGVVLLLNSQGCQVRLTGTPLTMHGAADAVELGRELAARYGAWIHSEYATRMDAALDVTGYEPRYPLGFRLNSETGKGRKPKPTFYGLDPDAGTFETVTIGRREKKGGGLHVMVYDKLAELAAKDHADGYAEHLRRTWTLNGWDGVASVRRLEVAALRAKLQANGVTIAQAIADPRCLVALGTGWVTPTLDAATVALWEGLRANYSLPDAVKPSRRRSVPDDDSLSRQYVGLVARYAVLHDLDFDDAASRLFYCAQTRLEHHDDWDALKRTYRGRYGLPAVSGAPF